MDNPFKVVEKKTTEEIQERNEYLIDSMEMRMFEFVKEQNDKFLFIDKSEMVICEVNPRTNVYSFVYANQEMYGFLTSGPLENVFDIPLFDQAFIQFKEPVGVLREYYEA